jgi:uncharacterized membrane protein YeaQ/YmgE (transglycosylase-associated protein family)
MVMWFVGWLLIGAFVGWLTSVLWRNPQGCIWDGAIAIAGMLAGMVVYGVAVGSPELLELDIFGVIAGVLTALVALAIARALSGGHEGARVVEPGTPHATGWEPEDAYPAPKRPLSERPKDEPGQSEVSETEREEDPPLR